MKKKLTLTVAIGVLLGCSLLALAQESEAPAGPPPSKVVVKKVMRKELAPTVRLAGIIDYDRTSMIMSEVSGLIRSKTMKTGIRVKKGDLLFDLDIQILEKRLKAQQASIDLLKIRLEKAKKDLKRYEQLYKDDAYSQKGFEDQLYLVKEYEQQIISGLVELERLKLEKKKSRVIAPYNGIILEQHQDIGAWISSGTPVYTLGSTEDMVIRVAANESLRPYLKAGDTVHYQVEVLGIQSQGMLESIVPVADLSSKSFDVKIHVDYQDEFIQNMTAYANIPAAKPQELALIPRDAIVNHQGGTFVYTVKEGKAEILPIHVVAYQGNDAAADNPYFTPDVSIIIDGNERVRPGAPVQVVPEIGGKDNGSD